MLTIYPYTYRTLQYKLEDVAPVSLAMYTHHVLSVGPPVPESVKTLKDFFAWAKANPDKAAYGSPGAGSMPHLIGVLIAKASGTELRHAAYRGSAPGQDLLGGQIAARSSARWATCSRTRRPARCACSAPRARSASTFLPAFPPWASRACRSRCGSGTPSSRRRAGRSGATRRAAPVLAQTEVLEFGGSSASSPVVDARPRRAPEHDAAEWGGLVKQTGFTADSWYRTA